MKANQHYRITYDIPQHDLTILTDEDQWETNVEATVVEVHRGDVWTVGSRITIYTDTLEGFIEVDAPVVPVEDGFYRYRNGDFFLRHNSRWYELPKDTRNYDSLVPTESMVKVDSL